MQRDSGSEDRECTGNADLLSHKLDTLSQGGRTEITVCASRKRQRQTYLLGQDRLHRKPSTRADRPEFAGGTSRRPIPCPPSPLPWVPPQLSPLPAAAPDTAQSPKSADSTKLPVECLDAVTAGRQTLAPAPLEPAAAHSLPISFRAEFARSVDSSQFEYVASLENGFESVCPSISKALGSFPSSSCQTDQQLPTAFGGNRPPRFEKHARICLQ